MIKKSLWKVNIILAIVVMFPLSQTWAEDSLLHILQDELKREMKLLSEEDEAPYYISFRVDDIQSVEYNTSFGSLISKNNNKYRIFTPDVRLGDYSFDNTHLYEDESGFGFYGNGANYANLPLDNSPGAIKHAIWIAVDESYKNALQKFTLLANKKPKDYSDSVKDFSVEGVAEYIQPEFSKRLTDFNEGEWVKKLKKYSRRFSTDTSMLSAQVQLKYYLSRKYFLSTEGAVIVQNYMLSQLQVMAVVRNKEGYVVPQHISFVGEHPDELLQDSVVIACIDKMKLLLNKLKEAKPAEAYAGPAILSPEASGVFFHEIFGHRVEGHRLEKAYDGQTFTDKVGKKVLPKDFSVVSDPTLNTYNNVNLIGTYKYDDEGVKSQKVQLVDKGILKNFLMSRQPTSKFPNSNGHGRAQPGSKPVSRQSNLIVYSHKEYSEKDLRKKLISECKKQKKEYGYYFKTVIGGFTVTDRYNPNVFNIMPSEVYRVYIDGRPDELVVGVELIGTPLTMFSNIEKAGNKPGIFSGFCGAESGYVPVTAISPALFVRKVETQKGMEIKAEIPILPSPSLLTE